MTQPIRLRAGLPGLFLAISAAAFGCSVNAPGDGADGVDPGDTTVADEAAGAEGAALDPAPAVSDVKPFLVDGRSYVARTDGSRIPLLTRAELEGTVSRAFGAFDAEGQLIAGKLEMMATPPPSYNLSVFQTPVKNQMDRGSCGTFASVGAIEAAYKRTYGTTLDLSEQYMFHVAKSTGVSYPRIYKYENQSSYWYGGGWPDVAATYMLPLESDAPYAGYASCPAPGCTPLDTIPGATSLAWVAEPADSLITQKQVDDFEYSPLHIPAAARQNARYGVASYTNYTVAQSRDTSLLESLIASNKEVVIAMELWWRDEGGIMVYDPTSYGGGHVMLLIGYDRAQGYFLVKNSWGGTAPSAYLKVSYDLLGRVSTGASTVNSVVPPSTPPQAKAKWMGKWNQDHDGWPGTLVVRRVTAPSNAPTRLGTYYAGGSYAAGHSANGLSIDGNTGLRFYVASEVENAQGTLTGQRFEADVYQWDASRAAGATWLGAVPGAGLYLGRAALPMPYSNTFSTAEWIGTWDLNQNGSPGTLRITGVTPTAGDYVLTATLLQGGIYKPVTGTVERARPTIAHLIVTSGGNVYAHTLHYHFWEDRLATGSVTGAGVVRTGEHAVRR